MKECKACGAPVANNDATVEFCTECLAYKQQVENARIFRAVYDREKRRRQYFGDVGSSDYSR